MGNNFNKMIILYKGKYHEIDKKPAFHQQACRHKYIKAEIVKTMGDLVRDFTEKIAPENDNPKTNQAILKLSKEQHWDKQPVNSIIAGMLGHRSKSVNLCRKCGKVKKRNN